MKLTSIEIHPDGFVEVVPPIDPPPDPPPTSPFDLTDSSGNGYDLLQNDPDITIESSLISGSQGSIGIVNTTYLGGYIGPEFSLIDGSWWACGWVEELSGDGQLVYFDTASYGPLGFVSWFDNVPGVSHFLVFTRFYTYGAPSSYNSWVASVPNSPGPHFIFASYNATTDQVKFYEDGVLVSTQSGDGHTSTDSLVAPTRMFVGYGFGVNKIYDEIACGIGIVSDATVAALYAARTDYATYTAAQLAMTPFAYWHLNATGVEPPPSDPPPSSTFLSYPSQSTPLSIDGQSDVEVSNKTFQGFTTEVAIVISNCQNVYLHDLDFDANGGDIFLIDCIGNLRIEDIRARHTGGIGEGSGGDNVIQFNNCWQWASDDGINGVRRVWVYGGHTEDMISTFNSGGLDALHPLVIENCHLESPLPPDSLAWISDSGTGIILADASGHDIIVRNNTLLNVGQVGIQLAKAIRCHILGNVVYGAQRALSNTGITQYGTVAGGTGNEVSNNRVFWLKEDGSGSSWWNGGGAGTITMVGNVWQDTTIDPADLAVVL